MVVGPQLTERGGGGVFFYMVLCPSKTTIFLHLISSEILRRDFSDGLTEKSLGRHSECITAIEIVSKSLNIVKKEKLGKQKNTKQRKLVSNKFSKKI